MRMTRSILVIISIIFSLLACTTVKVVRYEPAPQVKENKNPTFDFSGLTDEQKEVLKTIIEEIIPLIKEGKNEREIKKISRGCLHSF